MKKMTYKIVSNEFHKNFNSFTLEENKTYYLIGKNGIGKSSLLRFFGNPRAKFYDIETEILVTKRDVRHYLNDVNLSSHKLNEIIEGWEDHKLKIKYSELRNLSDEKFNKIKKKIMNAFSQEISKKISDEVSKIKKKIDEYVKFLKWEKRKINNYLDKRILIREIKDQRLFYDKKENERKINDIDKMVISIYDWFKKIDFLSKDSFSNRYQIDGFFWYNGFNIPKIREFHKDIKININNINNTLWNKGRNKGLFFENIAYSLLINIDKYININENYFRFNSKKSRGEHCSDLLIEQIDIAINSGFAIGLALDEPFNSLDANNIEKIKRKLDEYKGTKIITTHSPNILKGTDLKNTIVFFELDGKRAISNLSNLKNIDISVENNEIKTQISTILNTWFSEYKGNVLLVEGHYDYLMIEDYIKDIVVIPLGGALMAKSAIGYHSYYANKIKYLFDRDKIGKKAAQEMAQILGPDADLGKSIFKNANSQIMTIEELISGQSFGKKYNKKQKLRNDIIEGKYIQKQKWIGKKIIESFKH